jgi:hypothetical protein
MAVSPLPLARPLEDDQPLGAEPRQRPSNAAALSPLDRRAASPLLCSELMDGLVVFDFDKQRRAPLSASPKVLCVAITRPPGGPSFHLAGFFLLADHWHRAESSGLFLTPPRSTTLQPRQMFQATLHPAVVMGLQRLRTRAGTGMPTGVCHRPIDHRWPDGSALYSPR